jgi:hypothetical protein
MPHRDLFGPAHDGLTEPTDVGRAVGVLNVMTRPMDKLDCELGVVGVLEVADGLFGVRGGTPRCKGRRRQAAQAAQVTSFGDGRRVVRRPWSATCGIGRADRPFGPGGQASRVQPCGERRRDVRGRASRDGTDRQPARRHGASCRTRVATDPTDPAPPNRWRCATGMA